jgi:hypothetical protein
MGTHRVNLSFLQKKSFKYQVLIKFNFLRGR